MLLDVEVYIMFLPLTTLPELQDPSTLCLFSRWNSNNSPVLRPSRELQMLSDPKHQMTGSCQRAVIIEG